MNRIDVRSKENWRRFDFWAIIVCLLLLLLMLIAWLAGARFMAEGCCQDEIAQSESPSPLLATQDYQLNFFSAGDKIVLEGTVADQSTHDSILAAAYERFGEDNVVSNLKIDGRTRAFDSNTLSNVLGQLSGVNDFRLNISPDRWLVSGNTNDEITYNRLSNELATAIGEDTTLDNQLSLIELGTEDYKLNFFKASDKIVLEGAVADQETLDSIVNAAYERFGEDNVVSNLTIDERIRAFDTSTLGNVFGQLIDINDFRLTITPAQWSIFGNTSDEVIYNRLRDELAITVGEGTTLDNQLSFVEIEPVLNCELLLSTNPVEFEFNSEDMTAAGQQAIAQTMQCLESNLYEIIGHTDSTGDADFNQQLSVERATTVRNYLGSLGVDVSGYQISGKGETEPLVDGDNEEAYQRNRRVEFKPL